MIISYQSLTKCLVKFYSLWIFRLAETGKSPKVAEQAGRVYFDDLNDMFVFATKKDSAKITAAYEKSKADIATFKSAL